MIERKDKIVAKILLADDDLEILELLKFTFEQEHYTVISAQDGLDAFQRVREEKPDIVILDVNMPRFSGFEVCEKIRQDPELCLIPVIMLTSLTKTKDRLTGIKLGADEYLSKPFEPIELVARAEGLLRRTRESLSANPLTGLPGNVSIEKEIKRRLETQEVFACIYVDVDNFKSFNDKYGFARGDAVIRLVSGILRSAVGELGSNGDFLGHIGGEDFIIVTAQDKAMAIAEKVIKNFDEMIPPQYDEDVRKRGYLWGVSRQGQEIQFPIMTLSMGIAKAEKGTFQHYSQVVERAKDMLKKAKAENVSTFVMG